MRKKKRIEIAKNKKYEIICYVNNNIGWRNIHTMSKFKSKSVIKDVDVDVDVDVEEEVSWLSIINIYEDIIDII